MFYYYCTDHFVGSYVSPQGNGALKGGKAFTVPGTYCLGDGTNAAGTLTRWVRDLLYSKELDAGKAGRRKRLRSHGAGGGCCAAGQRRTDHAAVYLR